VTAGVKTSESKLSVRHRLASQLASYFANRQPDGGVPSPVSALSNAIVPGSVRELLVAVLAIAGLIAASTHVAHAKDFELTADEAESQARIAILDSLTAEEIDSAVTVISGSVPTTRNGASWVLNELNLQAENFSLTLADQTTTIDIANVTLSLPAELVGVGLRGQQMDTESGPVVVFDSVLCECDDFRGVLSFRMRVPIGQASIWVSSETLFPQPPEFNQPIQLALEQNVSVVLTPTEILKLNFPLDLSYPPYFDFGTADLIADLYLRLVPEPDSTTLAVVALAALALIKRKANEERGRC